MQIVINIPTELYERLMESDADDYDGFIEGVLVDFIQRGTPLPKGHGRLIDADELKTHFIGTEQGTDLEVYLEPTIINAPTIIEADEVESGVQEMTKEEAKELISEMWELLFQEMRKITFEDISENGRLEKYTEAHSLVIEALEQMPCNTLSRIEY